MQRGRDALRKATSLIVMKDGEYLSTVGSMASDVPIWDHHLSNAWKTRNREKARMVAEQTGGILALFNSIIWEVRVL